MMTVFRRTAKQLCDLINLQMCRPSQLRLGLRDFFDLRLPPTAVYDNSIHLRAAMNWLCRAQDATPDGGVAARYRLSMQHHIEMIVVNDLNSAESVAAL